MKNILKRKLFTVYIWAFYHELSFCSIEGKQLFIFLSGFANLDIFKKGADGHM